MTANVDFDCAPEDGMDLEWWSIQQAVQQLSKENVDMIQESMYQITFGPKTSFLGVDPRSKRFLSLTINFTLRWAFALLTIA